jgi:hypothetical protein
MHTSKLSTDNPFPSAEDTETTAGDILGSFGRDEVKGRTVTLERFSLNGVPDTITPGRVFWISVPTEGSKLIIQTLPYRKLLRLAIVNPIPIPIHLLPHKPLRVPYLLDGVSIAPASSQ